MKARFVLNQLGMLSVVLSAVMLVIAAWAGVAVLRGNAVEKPAFWALLIASGIGITIGLAFWFIPRRGEEQLGRREALLLVAASWLGGAAVAALPYAFWAWLGLGGSDPHPFDNPVDCYFEAMSGLTTTGATILPDIGTVPRSLLLWRATTHWLGGLGIVVLFVAVLPTLGVGGKRLFRYEAPGPEPEGVRPHIRETARILWLIYLGLTITEVLALHVAGMSWFDAVCHTFATLATGGFSTQDASIAAFPSPAIQIIIIVFMVLAGINFGLYYHLIRGNLRFFWRDTELRTYIAILAVVSLIVSFYTLSDGLIMTTGQVIDAPSYGQSLLHSVFTVVSLQTTTGFCTADFNHWSFLPKALLIILMFIGASAGSTGGGIKVIRILIAGRAMVAELERSFRPSVVRPVRIGKVAISPELKQGTMAYCLGILGIFGAGAILIRWFEQGDHVSITTAATASVATLCNIGPGLELVGASSNYAWFTDGAKVVMSILMALGRLEVFALAVLFVPRFWRNR